MTVGFILITISPGHEDEVSKQLSKEKKVVEIDPLVGEYDIIVKVKGNSREEIGEFVIGKVRTIKGVIDTKTLLGTLIS